MVWAAGHAAGAPAHLLPGRGGEGRGRGRGRVRGQLPDGAGEGVRWGDPCAVGRDEEEEREVVR